MMSIIIWIGLALLVLVVLFVLVYFTRASGVRFAMMHPEEVFGKEEPLHSEYLIGGKWFYQKPLVLKQMREITELHEKYKDSPGRVELDPEFFSIVLIDGKANDDGGTVGKTPEKTAWFANERTGIDSVIAARVSDYFFALNKSCERIAMFKKLIRDVVEMQRKEAKLSDSTER